MFGIRDVFLLSLVINVLVNGYQDDGNLDGELEVLLKRLQERLEDEERGHELEDLFERKISSGIEIDDEVSSVCNEMKNKGAYKWALLKIENNKRVVVDQLSSVNGFSEDEDQFSQMKGKLTSTPRYILFDFNFNSVTGRNKHKLALIYWCDDESSTPFEKIIYASSVEMVNGECIGLSLFEEAESKADLVYETYRAKIERLS